MRGFDRSAPTSELWCVCFFVFSFCLFWLERAHMLDDDIITCSLTLRVQLSHKWTDHYCGWTTMTTTTLMDTGAANRPPMMCDCDVCFYLFALGRGVCATENSILAHHRTKCLILRAAGSWMFAPVMIAHVVCYWRVLLFSRRGFYWRNHCFV